MDETQVSSGPSWWENTIDFVVRAAATKQYSSPQLQSGQSYYVDQNGQVLPMGQHAAVLPTQVVGSLTSNPLVMLAGLALAGLLLYKLVK